MQLTRAVSTFVLPFIFGASIVSAQPPAGETPPSAAPGAPAILENRGQPIVLPYACSADDIQWGGLSCAEDQPCAIFLELSAVEAAGPRIVVAGNLHAESVTLYSVLLASDDDGRTWTEVHPRMRGATLDHIQFLNATTGWISGEELFALPQNPFLLLTTDGGKTWSRRPVFGDSSEDRFGMVQQFSFADKDDGSLIVDRGQPGSGRRYSMYHSRTGGESWDIVQETSKPLRLTQSPPASLWRVRVDAATHSFHVEHRQDDRWTSVAAFAVTLAPCR